jgi:hypothetical protein
MELMMHLRDFFDMSKNNMRTATDTIAIPIFPKMLNGFVNALFESSNPSKNPSKSVTETNMRP